MSIVDRLERLAGLLDVGALTPEEFVVEKRKLLAAGQSDHSVRDSLDAKQIAIDAPALPDSSPPEAVASDVNAGGNRPNLSGHEGLAEARFDSSSNAPDNLHAKIDSRSSATPRLAMPTHSEMHERGGIMGLIAGHAARSADTIIEFHQPAEAVFVLPEIAQRLEKIRLWVPLVCLLIVIGNWMDLDWDFWPVIYAINGTVFFSGVAGITYLWTDAKLARLGLIARHLDSRIAGDATLRDEVDRLRGHIHEVARTQVAAEAASAPQRRNEQEIRGLQSALRGAYQNAATSEAQGDFKGAGYWKGEAARIESKLRGLGA